MSVSFSSSTEPRGGYAERVRDFMRGIADFGDSFAWFRRTPKAMQTALIPAAVVWVVLAAAVVAFLV